MVRLFQTAKNLFLPTQLTVFDHKKNHARWLFALNVVRINIIRIENNPAVGRMLNCASINHALRKSRVRRRAR